MELLEEFPVGLTFEMGLEDEVGVHQPDRKVRQICVLEKNTYAQLQSCDSSVKYAVDGFEG